MIPFSDQSEPNRIFPYVNIAFIAINFLLFFYELALQSQGHLNHFYLDYALVPCEYTSHCNPVPGTPTPFFVTLFSSMFMHAGWLHILGNMVFLWVFGDNVENSMGHVRYFLFYLVCGLGANALEIGTAINSHVPGLGASGAIAGILAAYLMLYPTSRVRTIVLIGILPLPLRLPAWVLIGFWILLQFVDGVATLSALTGQSQTGGVAYWAHVGGFITGGVLIWVFRHPARTKMMKNLHTSPIGT
ncbi:MAG: rhomboid family intramembrane serine protease [Chloroflexota bacterium]